MNDLSNRDLYASFVHAVQETSEVGGNPVLAYLGRVVEDIDEADDDFVRRSKDELSTLLGHSNMGLDGRRTRELIQRLGEVHFYVLCKGKGLDLLRVSEGHDESPDFRTESVPAEYFEIKTPCLTGGEQAIAMLVENSYRGRLDIQHQLDAGTRIAFSTQEYQPYGSIKLERRLSHVIGVLQEKLRQNLHSGQFAKKPTYLVCSLLMLPTYGNTVEILRPTYCRRSPYGDYQPITGELWMTAFSRSGMLIQSQPEFEGKPSIEGPIDSFGILADTDFDYVGGIIFVVYGLSGKRHVMALLRSEDDMTDTIFHLVGHDWNDRNDGNGWTLNTKGDHRDTGSEEANEDPGYA